MAKLMTNQPNRKVTLTADETLAKIWEVTAEPRPPTMPSEFHLVVTYARIVSLVSHYRHQSPVIR